MSDDILRPAKRRKLGTDDASSVSEYSNDPSDVTLTPLPPAVLLVSLPSLLAHPPNHRFYIQSLVLSLAALRKCLSIPALSPEVECRAWTGLAEIGMKVISGGMSQDVAHPWAERIEAEVCGGTRQY